ncbi:biopolymer transporter ExbD, partial [candidate division FCPU426 bacterium]|nr:biopolymer transporter ExbD [candidate division FCPU426 bacterium]
SIDINLPKAHVKKDAAMEKVNIMISKAGKLYINGMETKLTDLETHLKAIFSGGADPTVTVAADELVPYGDAVKVLDIARQAGAQKLVLAAEPLPVQPLSEELLSK